MKTKFVRLLATGAIVLAGGLIATTGTAGAQSVPVDQPPAATNPPTQPAQPPVAPPSNGANVGGAGTGLPSTGTGGTGDDNSTASLAFGTLAMALAAGGVASWRLSRRVR